jgi:BASS family bile acid:Na+ symporter
LAICQRLLTHLRRGWKIFGRTGALFAAIGSGIVLTQGHVLSFLIPYMIVLMLFFAFLDLPLARQAFGKGVWAILVANVSIAFAAYFLLWHLSEDLALIAFLTAVTPTATAAPVLMSFLEGRVDYVVGSVVLTNVFMALMLPFVLPLVVAHGIVISTWEVLRSVLLIVFLPLALARLCALLPAHVYAQICRRKPASFYIWVITLYLVTSKAASFVFHEVSVPGPLLISIALTSLVICVVNFSAGALIGGKEFRREASQSLGQKNSSFSIWLALTFVSPIAALGPTFYVVWHNLYNSLQLYLHENRTRRGTL